MSCSGEGFTPQVRFKFGQHDAYDRKNTANYSCYKFDVQEQIVDVPVPQVLEAIVKVVQIIPGSFGRSVCASKFERDRRDDVSLHRL